MAATAIATAVLLAFLWAGHRYEQYQTARFPQAVPIPATPPQQREIVRAVLMKGDFLSLPERSQVLVDLTITACARRPRRFLRRGVDENCDWQLSRSVDNPQPNSPIASQFLRELRAANLRSMEMLDPGLKGVSSRRVEEINRVLAGPGSWEAFRRTYPGSAGVVRFSRATLDRSGARALVYAAYSCGRTCGSGALVLLSKHKETWRVIGHQPVWQAD